MTEPKRGRGRPRLSQDDETVRVIVGIPASELAEIDAAAEQLGVSRAELIRDAAIARARRTKR